MRVWINLFLTFKKKSPDGKSPFVLELSDGLTVAQALKSISISPSEAKVVLLNGRISTDEKKLKDGDQLTIFPPIEGG